MEFILRKLINFLPKPIRERVENLNSELLSGSAIFFATKIIGLFFTYLFVWWFSSQFGATKWGFVAYCITLLNVIGIICLMGYDTILLKYISEFKSQNQFGRIKDLYLKAFIPVVITSVVIGTIVFLNAPYLTKIIFGNPTQSPWIQVLAIGIPGYTIFQLNNSVLGGSKEMFPYGVLKNIFHYGFALIFGIITYLYLVPNHFPRFEESGILIFLAFTLTLYLGIVVTIFILYKKINPLNGLDHSFTFRELFNQSYPLVLATSMSLIVISADIIMLGILRPENEVGIYDVAVKISFSTTLFLMAFNAILPAQFSELFSKGKKVELRNLVRQSTKLIFWATAPILFVIAVFSKSLLGFFGPEFTIASTVLIILAFSQFINSVSGAVGTLLKMTNNQVVFQNIMIFAALVNIVLNWFLIPTYGIIGAAISTAICCSTWNFLSVFYANKILGINTLYIPFITK